ncbi:hypothetical protein PUN28_002217 [Cardiocondyla obscurior]|uniref:Uncharacterized protein n=1 Tax=Cardiocondyla obscurior TaxID=286306 RepID=A0AAW2GSX4_9HYME
MNNTDKSNIDFNSLIVKKSTISTKPAISDTVENHPVDIVTDDQPLQSTSQKLKSITDCTNATIIANAEVVFEDNDNVFTGSTKPQNIESKLNIHIYRVFDSRCHARKI